MDWDVVVIGAGMAGLTGARALAERGCRVLVLEARERVGGRIATVRVRGQEAIELGAEFVHGRPSELWGLVAEAGCEVYEREGAQVCFEDGRLAGCEEAMKDAFDPLDELKEYRGEDVSFVEYLDLKGLTGETRGSAVGYVEGFNAADAGEVSVLALGVQQSAEDAIEGNRVFKVKGGYDQLPEYLVGGCGSLAERCGRRHGWWGSDGSGDGCRWPQTGVSIAARRALVTLPLGVLLAGGVTIDPEPAGVMRAAREMRMGQVCRFTVAFRTRFWEAVGAAAGDV